MPSSQVIDLSNPPEGFKLEVGDVVVYESERIVPLGGVVYSEGEILSQVRDRILDESLQRGIELVSVSSAIEAVGVFRYRLRIRYLVLSFQSLGVQEASLAIWDGIVLIIVSLALGYAAYAVTVVVREGGPVVSDVSSAFSTIAVAASLIALVYLLSKRP